MKTKSEALIKAIADGTAGKPGIDIYIYSEYSTSEGGTIAEHLVDKDIWADGFKIEKATSSDNSFDVGGAIVGKLTFVVNRAYTHDDYTQSLNYYGKKCRVVLTYDVDGTQYPVEMGYFNIVDIQYNTQTTTFTAYDDLYLFDKPYTNSKLTFPATLQEIVADACSCCNVKWDGKAFTHDDYVINSKPDKVTFREMLAYIGQITCHFARMTADGFLEFAWYKNTDDNKWNQKSSYSRDAAMQQVTITGTRLIYKTENKDAADMETEVRSGTNGYMITIQNNPLIDLCGTSPQLICDNLLADLKKTPAFLPGKMDIPANPLIDCGDIIGYWSESKQAYLYDTLVTGISYSPSEKTEIRCGGDSSTRISSTQYDVSTKNDLYTYDLLKANRAYEKSEREKAIADLTEKISNSSGLFTTKQTDSSGATIYYMHDLPELAESKIIWKMTSEAVAVSTDGGKTYNAGITINGDVLARILNATGINADWIRTGTISASIINGGILKVGGKNNDYGRIYIYDANGTLTGYIQNNSIVLSDTNNSHAMLSHFSDDVTGYSASFWSGGNWIKYDDKVSYKYDVDYSYKGIRIDVSRKKTDRGFEKTTNSVIRLGCSGNVDPRFLMQLDGKQIVNIEKTYPSTNDPEYTFEIGNNAVLRVDGKSFFSGDMNPQNVYVKKSLHCVGESHCEKKLTASRSVVINDLYQDEDYFVINNSDHNEGDGNYLLKVTNSTSPTNSNILYNNCRLRQHGSAYFDSVSEFEGKADFNTLVAQSITSNTLKVSYTKSRVADTADYGNRQLYCYETPTPYFGDIGEGEIADDGSCYVFIDPIFSETITTAQYQVFLQAYGKGELYVKERKGNYFVVAGTPHLQFGWEIKAKQKGFDQLRIKKDVGDDEIKPEKANFGDLAEAHLASITNSYKNAQPADTTAKTAN